MSTVQCITCQHFTLRTAGSMAREGFGNCAQRRPHEFMGATYQRVCAKYAELDADAVAKRREWLEGQR